MITGDHTKPSIPEIADAMLRDPVVQEYDLDERIFLPQLRLHLQRFNAVELADSTQVRDEVLRLAARAKRKRERAPRSFAQPLSPGLSLEQTRICRVDSTVAAAIHETCHYLMSPRPQGLHLGLENQRDTGRATRLLALISMASFDLAHLKNIVPSSIEPREILVLSRLASPPLGPRNLLSFALARTGDWLREKMPEIKLLVTYLDPNVGFSGAVYRASNWFLVGAEKKLRYLFLDGNYATERQMIMYFGTADFKTLQEHLGSRVQKSVRPLEPLQIYAYFLDKTLREPEGSAARETIIHPPSTLVEN